MRWQFVADQIGSGLDRLHQRRVLDNLAYRAHLTIAIGIDHADLPRIYAYGAGDFLHLDLDGKAGLCHAEAAHGRGWLTIGINAIGIDPDVRDIVRAGHIRHMLLKAIGRVSMIGAGILQAAHLAPDDASIVHDGITKLYLRPRARRGAAKLFFARPAPFYRAPRLHRGNAGNRLGDDIDLAAKAPAHSAAYKVQAVCWHLENNGGVIQ